jgi:subtilisin-like proprotein convertase family protein
VYWITEIIDRELSGGYDHTVSRVDRPVVGRNPVRIARDTPPPVGTELVMIGHPAVMPKKIAGGAEVKSIAGPDTFLRSNLDAYGGNSGSMVIRTDTYEVVGILVRGAPDYRTRPGAGCTESNRVPDTGNTGSGLMFEEVSLTMRFQDFIPEIGMNVSPAGNTTHIGVVGGPFTNDTVVYELGNPTQDPIDYAVSFSNPNGAFLLDGSVSAPGGGTLMPGGSVQYTLTLAPGASVLSRGVYQGSVTFFDLDNSVSNERVHTLEIGQTLISVSPTTGLTSGGPEGGPFNATQMYTVSNQRPTPVEVEVIPSASWVSVSTGSFLLAGQGDAGSTVDVTVGFSNDAGSLPSGLYNASVRFVNMDTDAETIVPVVLDVGRFLYTSTDTPIAITDNSSFTSTIVVPDTYCVGDLEVDIDITHTFIGDLRVILTSPSGVSVTLHDRTGGSADDIVRRYSISEPADGPGSMSDFIGQPVGGTWSLFVSDNAGGDIGTLNSWSLRPQTSGAQCPPIALDGSASGATNQLLTFDLQALAAGSGNVSYVVTSLPTTGVLWDGNTSIVSVPHAMTANSPTLTYRPAIDDVGSYAFTFYATEDGYDSGEATQTVSIGATGVVWEETMDTNPGWTTEGDWAWGQPTASGGNPSSGATGPNVYGYNLNGAYPNNLPVRYLTTTPIDASGFAETTLRFQRWLGVEHSTYDRATIEVSTNGTSWTEIWRNPAGFGNTIIDTSWNLVEYDISAIADGASTLYIRWGMGPTDSSVTYSGWNIDDVQLVGLLPVGCAADLTGPSLDGVPDGAVNAFDLNFYVAAWLAGAPVADMTGPALNGVPDGFINAFDLSYYITLFLGDCD